MTVQLEYIFDNNMDITNIRSIVAAENSFIKNMIDSINKEVGYNLISKASGVVPILDDRDPDCVMGVLYWLYQGDPSAPDQEIAGLIGEHMKNIDSNWRISILQDVQSSVVKH